MMWLSKFRVSAFMPRRWTKLPCIVKHSDPCVISRRGIQSTTPKFDRRRAGSTNLWSQVFPVIRNPDDSVNHRAAQQYVLMMFITFQLGLMTMKKMGEENKDLDEPSGTTDQETDKPSTETGAVEQETNKPRTETVAVEQEADKPSTETVGVEQETDKPSKETVAVAQETNKSSKETVAVAQETNKLSSTDIVPK